MDYPTLALTLFFVGFLLQTRFPEVGRFLQHLGAGLYLILILFSYLV